MRLTKDQKKEFLGLVVWGIIGLIVMSAMMSLAGCTSVKYVPVETVRTEIQYKDRLQRDSVYVKDSVFLLIKGDTVFRDRWHTVYKDKVIRDTFYVYKTDSIQVPYPVEKKLTGWQTFKQKTGGFAMAAIVVVLLIVFIKMVYKLKKGRGV